MNNYISNVKNVAIILILLFTGFLAFENHKLRNESQNNYVILTDSLNDYKNKIGELYKEQESYVIEKNDLKKINEDLYNEIKYLKENPIIITKTEIKYQIKEIEVKNDSIVVNKPNNIIENFYNYKDEYFSANISHKLNLLDNMGNLSINNISSTTNLYLDIIEKDKKPFIITRMDNPYLTISNIEGGFIDLHKSKLLSKYYKKEYRWNLSFNAGVFMIYNLNTNRFEAGPGFGFSLGRAIAQW